MGSSSSLMVMGRASSELEEKYTSSLSEGGPGLDSTSPSSKIDMWGSGWMVAATWAWRGRRVGRGLAGIRTPELGVGSSADSETQRVSASQRLFCSLVMW